jgi:hypothetical protein
MKDKAPEEGAELEWTDTRIETKIIIAHGKNSKKRMGSPTSSNDDAERLEVAAEAAAETTKENQTSPKRIRIKDASHSEREVEAAHILCTLAPLPPLPCTFFMTTVGAHPPLDKTTPHLFF